MRVIQGDIRDVVSELKHWKKESVGNSEEVQKRVQGIIENIKQRGDEALREYTEAFDGILLKDFRVKEDAIEAAFNNAEGEFLAALQKAKENIWRYHEKQKRQSFIGTEEEGVVCGQLIRPLDTVAVYVPGGTAVYPSSVLMNVIPAKIAGVQRIIMITPPGKEGVNPAILVAAKLVGVDEIYTIGGAQAIAAVAYGTDSIPKVDKIVGPGNIYVALAKREVYGEVAIDMIAGPSEIVVIADESANPAFIAADMLSQAEHDSNASAICITTSKELAGEIEGEVARQLALLPRKEIAEQSIEQNGAVMIVESITEAIYLSNEIAPEHLELHVREPMTYLSSVKHAGSIFLGPYAPEPLGDYLAGPNHVLPTSGTARFSSPLGVDDFVKKSSFLSYTKEALEKVKDHIVVLAEKEGLDAHARAIQIRFEEEGSK